MNSFIIFYSLLKLSLLGWKILPIGITLEYLSNSRYSFIVQQDDAVAHFSSLVCNALKFMVLS